MAKKTKRSEKKPSKKTTREYMLLGGGSVAISAALVISIFFAASLDTVLIRSQQYASVLSVVLVEMANDDRSQNKLDGLTINPILTRAAQMKADDMAAKSYFAHTSPEGLDPWHWFEEVGYKFTYAGENLAVDFNDSSEVNKAWMNSPAHRANILDEHYTEIGIATAQGFYQGHPTTFVVQEFGAPLKEEQAPKQIAQNIPKNSTEIAVAKPAQTASAAPAKASTTVLGASTVESAPTQPSMTIEPLKAVERAVASPKMTLRYVYYALAVIFLVGLAVAAEFEFHVRHMKKALATSALIALMLGLFWFSDKILFPRVQVPDALMAAAAKAL